LFSHGEGAFFLVGQALALGVLVPAGADSCTGLWKRRVESAPLVPRLPARPTAAPATSAGFTQPSDLREVGLAWLALSLGSESHLPPAAPAARPAGARLSG